MLETKEILDNQHKYLCLPNQKFVLLACIATSAPYLHHLFASWNLLYSLSNIVPFIIATSICVLAIVPSLLILFWLNQRTSSSTNTIAKYYTIGLISVFPVAVYQYAVESFIVTWIQHFLRYQLDYEEITVFIALSFVTAFLVVATSEEGLKCFIGRFGMNQNSCSTVVDLTLSAAIGMATFENLLYVTNTLATDGLYSAFVTTIGRGALAIPLHASTSVLIGANLSNSKSGSIRNTLKSLRLPVLLHGLYDLMAFSVTDLQAAMTASNYVNIIPSSFINGNGMVVTLIFYVTAFIVVGIAVTCAETALYNIDNENKQPLH